MPNSIQTRSLALVVTIALLGLAPSARAYPPNWASDGNGTVDMVEWESDRVLRRDPDGTLSTVLGPEGDETVARFDEPTQIASGTDGRIYVYASASENLWEIAPDGSTRVVLDHGCDYRGHRLDSYAWPMKTDGAGNVHIHWGVEALRVPPVFSHPLDPDYDGHRDDVDNCLDVQNSRQIDSDGDGHGDYCDADFEGDGFVGVADWLQFGLHAGSSTGDTGYREAIDLDSDGTIGEADFESLRELWGKPPGPSAP